MRPTPDRVRETLFNWLQFELAGQRCLDLYAGSGALGLEGLSRGAAEVIFVEREPQAAAAIQSALQRLGCTRGRVEVADALEWLARPGRAQLALDGVFLDPPYGQALLPATLAALERSGCLAAGAWAYLEDAAGRGVPEVPPGWQVVRSKRAGDVGYHLARRAPGSP